MLRAWLALLLVLGAACGGARPPAPAKAVPDELRARYGGRVLVLDFWAGWCAPCRDAVPPLRRLAEKFGPRGLVVVGVNAGEDATTALAAAAELGITYPVLLDESLALSDRVAAGQLPALLVIDDRGAIVHRARTLDRPTLDVIRRMLGVPPGS